MKKINVLKKIEPMKYNELFSIHYTKAFSRERKNHLPMISHFSRNFTNTMNKTSYLFNTYGDSNNNKSYSNFYPNNKTNEPKNFKKISFPNFKLKNYLKSSNFKNKKNLNIQSLSNKINEITFNINTTENNSSERKYYSIDLKRAKVSLTKDKINLQNFHSSEKLQKEKDEFYNILNNFPTINNIINDFSYRIYYHKIPGENSDFKYFDKNGKYNSENKISNNLNRIKSYSNQKSNSYMKKNVFLEMILEKVMHKVEYKNQLNQEISINLVKNLLNKEINSMKNILDSKNNNYNFIKIAQTQDSKINNDKFKNDTKYNFKDIISKKNENYFQESSKNESYALTDRDYAIKRRTKIKSDEDNNLGEFIMSIGKDINENLEDFKNKNFENSEKLNPKNSNMKNMINKFLIGEKNKKKQGLHHFNKIKLNKKNKIDINNNKHRIIEIYQKYLLYKKYMKEIEENKKNEINNNKNQKIPYDKDSSNIMKNFVDKITSTNLDDEEELKEIKKRINKNMSINDMLAIIETDEEFETFMNGFEGYYSFGDGKKNIKEILKQIKNSNFNILSFKLMKNKDSNKSINNNTNTNSNYTLYSTNYNQFVDKALESLNKKSSNSNNKKIRNTFYNSTDKRNKLKNKKKILDEKINDKIDLNLFIHKEEDNKPVLSEDSKKNSPKKEENKSSPSRSKNKKRMKKDKEKEKDKKKDKKNEVITEDIKSLFHTIKKNTYSLNTIYSNGDLNELEKELLSLTNNLESLSSKDREQLLKYLNELEQALEKERNGTNNLYNKIKIKNLHYQIYQYILELYNKNLLKPHTKNKNSKYLLSLLKNFNFDQKLIKTVNSDEEEDEKEANGIIDHGNGENEEIDNLFISGKKRSHSLNIAKLRGYYKLYHKFLFRKIKNIKRLHKLNSAKKSWKNDEWLKFIAKHGIKNKPKFKKKKRKKYEGRNRLMAYEKYHIPLSHFFIEDEEIRQIKENQRIKNLKKQITEKKMKEFFRKIQRLKDETLEDYEKELKLLVDEQLDRIDYAKSKENESRVNNFIQDLDYSRNKEICSKIFYSQRMHFVSPIIFFSKKNKTIGKK